VGEGGLHEWRCRFQVEGGPGELDGIERVIYTLDRSFPSPVRRVVDRTTGFALEIHCWAAFTLHALVRYANGDEQPLALAVELPPPPKIEGAAVDGEEATAPQFVPPVLQTHEADLVLDGGGLRSIAFAGALEAANEAGITHWGQIAGSSAGALVAALLAAGYQPTEIAEILMGADYRTLYGWRPGGLPSRLLAGWSNRGWIRNAALYGWLKDLFASSPTGIAEPTFDDFARVTTPGEVESRIRYRLRIIVSDLTAARMIVLPDDLAHYEQDGQPIRSDAFPVIEAVVMSMSVPYWFKPFVLSRDGSPHYLMDGGLLTSFPVWLFDAPFPVRPTWGMRLRRDDADASESQRRPRNALDLARALLSAIMEAAREQEPTRNAARTLTIPVPRGIIGPQFSTDEVARLRAAGQAAGRAFFASRGTYLNSLGRGLPETAVTSA
jgi:NTE family protein